MLVSFIGCPASGKTTSAARVFASLKEDGFASELILEFARRHIAHQRRLSNGIAISLSDKDQIHIMASQLEAEEDFCLSGSKDLIVLADASPLLALMYMSQSARDSEEVQALIRRARALAPVLFYASPVPRRYGGDPNRIHSAAQAEAIDREMPEMLKKYAPDLKVIPLVSSMEGRTQQVLSYVTS